MKLEKLEKREASINKISNEDIRASQHLPKRKLTQKNHIINKSLRSDQVKKIVKPGTLEAYA